MFTEIVAAGTKNGIQIYDIRRGTKLAQSLGVGVEGHQGFSICDQWVAAVNDKKPVCHVYILNRGDTSAKLVFPFPEEIACLHSVSNGKYLVAGAKSGRVLVWATGTGQLLRGWDAHYGPVTALASQDGVLVTGGEDAVVHVWMLSQVLDQSKISSSAMVTPIASLTEHTMPITAIHLTQADILSGRGRVYTGSCDHTCKQWKIQVQMLEEKDGCLKGMVDLLATFLYPGKVNNISVDKPETRLFAATSDGLYQTNLYAYKKAGVDDLESSSRLTALGGSRGLVYSDCHIRYTSAEPNIIAVDLSFDGSLLVSASQSDAMRVWDTASRQCLRNINDKQLATGITQLYTRLAPPQLDGPQGVSGVGLCRPNTMLEQGTSPAVSKIAAIDFVPLQRVAIDGNNASGLQTASVKCRLEGLSSDMQTFDVLLNPDQESSNDGLLLDGLRQCNASSAEKQLAEMQQQLETLQRHQLRTRRLNDELYQSAVTEWLGAHQEK